MLPLHTFTLSHTLSAQPSNTLSQTPPAISTCQKHCSAQHSMAYKKLKKTHPYNYRALALALVGAAAAAAGAGSVTNGTVSSNRANTGCGCAVLCPFCSCPHAVSPHDTRPCRVPSPSPSCSYILAATPGVIGLRAIDRMRPASRTATITRPAASFSSSVPFLRAVQGACWSTYWLAA